VGRIGHEVSDRGPGLGQAAIVGLHRGCRWIAPGRIGQDVADSPTSEPTGAV